MGVPNKFEKYFKLLIYLVVIALINIAGITLFFRIDLTAGKIYSLSDVSKEVVSTLSEPLTVDVFFTRNLPAPHNQTERYLRDLLEEYDLHANRYFNYRFHDVSPEGEAGSIEAVQNQKLADNYGIHPVQIQVVEQDEVKFKRAYMGLVLIHGDMIERIPTILSTDGLEYQITTAIQKLNHKISVLLSLKDKIQVRLFLSSSLKDVAPYMGLDELPDYPQQLEGIIQNLNDKNYGRLEYTYVDPSTDQRAEEIDNKYNIMSLKWPDLPNTGIAAGSGVIGLVMEYGEKVIAMPLLSVMQLPIIGTQYELADIGEMEEAINESIEALVDINEDLGYLADHGTLATSGFSPMGMEDPDALTTFSSLVSRNYSLKPVNLKEDSIPESLGCLVIARPTEKFSDYELYQIDQALMRGTNLAFFLDAFNEEMPQTRQPYGFSPGPIYTPIDSGLEKLLNHYGIRVKSSFVMDEDCFKQRLAPQLGGGERPIYFAPLIKNENINNDLKFMKNIKGLVAIKISPLELDEKRIADTGLTARRLFSSSEKSWEMRDPINLNPMLISPPPSDEKKESMALAYLIEGAFPSYFQGKPMPVKSDQDAAGDDEDQDEAAKIETSDVPAQKKPDVDLSKIEGRGGFLAISKSAKIFLMASSEMLKDTVLDPEGQSPNAMFVLNVLDALNDREEIAVMRSKEQRFNPLMETAAFTKTFVKTFNIAGLPVLVIIFGIGVWLRRNSRKKQIQRMFQK